MQAGEEDQVYKMNKKNQSKTKAKYLKDLIKIKTTLSGRVESLVERYNNHDFKK